MATKKKKKKTPGTAARKVTPLSLLSELMHGRLFFSYDFFSRYWFYVVLITVLIVAYISMKYDTQNKMNELQRLEVDLNNAKTDCVEASARYNSRIRESQMVDMVDTMHIDLSAPDQPPYRLYDN